MAKYLIRRLDRLKEDDCTIWKLFLGKANGKTIFHNPDFLSYHKERFNEHHIGIYKGDQLLGIMPMAIITEGSKLIAKSPYGASYGGIIFPSVMSYSNSKSIVNSLIEYLKTLSVNELIITPSPEINYTLYSDTFLFVMMEAGFTVINSDVTSVVCLSDIDLEKNTFTSRARNMQKKAKKEGVTIIQNAEVNTFWDVMDKTFKRHGENPTHSKEELKYLNSLFPDDIYCDIAALDKIPIAGIAYFKLNEHVCMSFYLCNDIDYKETQALSMLVYESILKSQRNKFKYFDFGTSSVNMVARENIFLFKESFGAIGRFRKTFQLKIHD